jgi:hypothetical protein
MGSTGCVEVLGKTGSVPLHGIEPRYRSGPERDPATTLVALHRLRCARFVISTEGW